GGGGLERGSGARGGRGGRGGRRGGARRGRGRRRRGRDRRGAGAGRGGGGVDRRHAVHGDPIGADLVGDEVAEGLGLLGHGEDGLRGADVAGEDRVLRQMHLVAGDEELDLVR